ncbi:recombination protein NinG [Vibrio jasicida]|uniref:recombination protein NinG n=1 Tax=Vibrio jasicida TaxID=766224 RepID=UPI00069609DE|nr:recombination protein NinG [Vibrio jasicida]
MSYQRCTGCKKHFSLEHEMIVAPAGKFHSQECLIEYASQPENALRLIGKGQAIQAKAEREALAARKAALRPRKWYLDEAQKWFNLFVRLRDHNQPCISCGRKTGSKMNAGHYRSVADCSALRYHELNVHLQCEYCNRHKHGSENSYRKRLILKIGIEQVDWIEHHEPHYFYSVDELKSIITLYKLKCRALSATFV